jgi:hypothetical protein
LGIDRVIGAHEAGARPNQLMAELNSIPVRALAVRNTRSCDAAAGRYRRLLERLR